ncbi:c-type cytochrome [Hyphomonas sp.]|uniref:c-type cytochrome n=1 Tax=Hyphomonas sp. TaxID=87 RepID=UPI00391ADEEC
MGELGLNKIFGALLATALAMMALMELPKIAFGGGGGHYGSAEYATLTERMCSKFSYCIEIAEAASAGADAVAEVFDLGAALLAADLTRGERVFASQCATCHTIAPGGANGTGPNLYDTVGAPKAHIAGFNYSAAMANMGGEWTYENLDDWLRNPAAYLRGTSMSFAGIRRDPDRAAVIAYMAANTANPPPFPEPMAAAETEAVEGEEATGEEDAEGGEEGEPEAVEAPAEPAPAPEPADLPVEE